MKTVIKVGGREWGTVKEQDKSPMQPGCEAGYGLININYCKSPSISALVWWKSSNVERCMAY